MGTVCGDLQRLETAYYAEASPVGQPVIGVSVAARETETRLHVFAALRVRFMGICARSPAKLFFTEKFN